MQLPIPRLGARYRGDMRRRLKAAGLVVAVVTTIISSGSPPFASGWERSCGSVRVDYRDQGGREYILASKTVGEEVGCLPARKIARAYASRSHYARTTLHGERIVRNRFPRAVGRFRCSAEYLGSDIRHIVCRDGSSSVNFGWYDSSGYH